MQRVRHVLLFAVCLSTVCVKYIGAQSCREYSETCVDDKACCGGCCIDGICRDTYKDCRSMNDPCMEHYCPPDEECYIYQPQNCGGCGPSIDCRSVPPPPPERIIQPRNMSLPHNSAIKHNAIHLIASIFCMLLLIF